MSWFGQTTFGMAIVSMILFAGFDSWTFFGYEVLFLSLYLISNEVRT